MASLLIFLATALFLSGVIAQIVKLLHIKDSRSLSILGCWKIAAGLLLAFLAGWQSKIYWLFLWSYGIQLIAYLYLIVLIYRYKTDVVKEQ